MVKYRSRRNAGEKAQIAQSVEQRTENPRVAGSIPALGICGCSSMVELQPSKLITWVRFPSPAFVREEECFCILLFALLGNLLVDNRLIEGKFRGCRR